MAKRGADKYLTDRNWDQVDDDNDEEPGQFQMADEEVLKKRVIRKAKRRVKDGESAGSGSAFSGFTGLKPVGSNSNTFKGFKLNTIAAATPAEGFASTPFKVNTKVEAAKLDNTSSFGKPPTDSSSLASKLSKGGEEAVSQSSADYNRHLSALNNSVSQWINDHVSKNPLCDLTPIFLDYKKYLAEIDDKFGQSDQENTPNSITDSQDSNSPRSSAKSFHPSSLLSSSCESSQSSVVQLPEKDMDNRTTESVPVTNTQSNTSTQSTSSSFTIPGNSKTTPSPFKGFNIPGKSTLPSFSFTSSSVGVANGNEKAATTTQGTEQYFPPKPESNTVVEEDAFFTIRCKLYYKKDDAYVDRGVGQLHLKPLGNKTQLVVRADTSLGNILLNILLQQSLPVMKQGKNNVMISCIPNPPINEKEESKIVPMLIRVKTSDDADKLLKIIEEKKEIGKNGKTD